MQLQPGNYLPLPQGVTPRETFDSPHHRPPLAVVDPNILKREGAEDHLSALSTFIANAHNEIYAFYTEKSGFLTKNMSK